MTTEQAIPETRYADADGLSIAYQVFGSGTQDLLIVPGIVSHLDANWQHSPVYARMLRQWAQQFRVEATGDKVSGMAVHIGARVMAQAGAGEVLVSSTVKDLVAGSGIEFEPRGAHSLKGVPGEWQLHLALVEADA